MKTSYSLSSKILCLLVLTLFASCEKNDNDLQLEEDRSLKEQIIGNWTSTNFWHRSYTFNEDNTFIDSLFMKIDNIFIVREIISGNYKIDNGQLIFSNIQLVYFKGQEDEHVLGSGSSYDSKYVISFNEDGLVLNQKDIFELVSKTHSGMVGKWNHDKLLAMYDKRLENPYTGGIVKGVYDFKSDNTVDYQYHYVYDNISTIPNQWGATYELTDTKLNINNWSIYDARVSFGKNKMIWLYSDLTFTKHK